MLLVLFTHLVRTKLNTQICRWRFQVLLALVCTHGVAKHQWWALCSPRHEQWHCPEEAAFHPLTPSMVPPHQTRSLHTNHGSSTPTMVPPRLSGLYSASSAVSGRLTKPKQEQKALTELKISSRLAKFQAFFVLYPFNFISGRVSFWMNLELAHHTGTWTPTPKQAIEMEPLRGKF